MVARGWKNRASFSEATVAVRVGGAFKVLVRKRGESCVGEKSRAEPRFTNVPRNTRVKWDSRGGSRRDDDATYSRKTFCVTLSSASI